MGQTYHAVRALDCPGCRSLVLSVEDGDATSLRGDPRHPFARGFLCAKGEERSARITRDEALDLTAGRLGDIFSRHEPEGVLPYSHAGTMGAWSGGGKDRRFSQRPGASRLDRTGQSADGHFFTHPGSGAAPAVMHVIVGQELYNTAYLDAYITGPAAASVDDTVQAGVVCSPSVRWPRRASGHRGVNAVTPARLTGAGGSPAFRSYLVEVEKVRES